MNSPTESEKIRAMQEWIDHACVDDVEKLVGSTHEQNQEIDYCQKLLDDCRQDYSSNKLVHTLRAVGLHGVGTYGIVFHGKTLDGLAVAIKVLRPSAQFSSTARQRFELEGAALKRCCFPGVVPVLEVGQLADLPYIVMEFAKGGSLAEYLAGLERPLSVTQAVVIITELAETLHLAHQQGIIHRDLKPSNILLPDRPHEPEEQFHPLICDFGLARDLTGSTKITVTGATPLVGTVAYMSPEQALGRPWETTTASDIFSLGVTFFELLTQRRPFEAPSRVETLYKIAFSDPPATRTLNRAIPREVAAIVSKCLAKRPQDRYSSAAALASDLVAWKKGLPIAAQQSSMPEIILKWTRRNPIVASLCVLLTVTILSSAVVSTWLYTQAQRALAKSQQEQTRADQNLKVALSAVTDMGQYVAEEVLLDVPNANEKRLAIHEKSLEFFKQFAEQSHYDTLSLKRLAVAYHYTANAAEQVPGNADLEWELRQRQAELLLKLIEQEPGNASLYFAMFHNRLALGLKRGQGPLNLEAEQYLRHAIRLAPERREYQDALPTLLVRIGNYAVKGDERKRYVAEANELIQQNIIRDPSNMLHYKDLVNIQLTLAHIAIQDRRFDDAIGIARMALEICERDYQPTDEPYTKMTFQAHAYNAIVSSLLAQDDIQTLPETLSKYVEHARYFAKQQSKYARELVDPLKLCVGSAKLLHAAGSFDDARESLQFATELFELCTQSKACTPAELADLKQAIAECQSIVAPTN